MPLVVSVFFSLGVKFSEKFITRLSSISLILPAFVSVYLVLEALLRHDFPFENHLFTLDVFHHNFAFTVWLDYFSFGMLTLTHLLGLLVVRYSHGYLHLEKGYQRFFSTILFFIFGMYLISLAGTMDLFFAGWEIVGLSSFLLIAFYRSHTRSVSNAIRIYNIYRLCDVGLLMGAVMGHVLWHEASRFSAISGLTLEQLSGEKSSGLFVTSFLIIIASLGKSAQFPFHNWPSRAMEGPTPSSAIFYGALSIHAGIFLLIRTYSLWSSYITIQILVGLIGLTTFILSTLQEKVQSNIKGQIAYANTANIGLMYIELSLGLKNLVMVHLFCHALYRCFQLLVSPSIVLNSLTKNNKIIANLMKKAPTISPTLFSLAMSDFYLDPSWRGLNFLGWKRIYWKIKSLLGSHFLLFISLAILSYLSQMTFNISLLLTFLALGAALRALILHKNPFHSTVEMSLSVIMLLIGTYLVDPHHLNGIMSYAISIVPALMIVLGISYKFRNCNIRNFHALGTDHAFLANLFLISFMILAGMPISTAFMGEDIILEEIINYSHLMAALTTVCLTISGLVFVRIYSKLFMGRPNFKN